MSQLESDLQDLLIDTTGLEAVSHLVADLPEKITGSTFINLQDIYSRMGGEFKRVIGVLSIVDESAQELLEMIDSASISLNAENLRSVAHALKGVFLEVGASLCAEMALRVESIDQSLESSQAQELLAGLRSSVLIVTKLSQALLASNKLRNEEIR